MRYPIAIEPGDARHAFGVVVPDLAGCFSAGDTLDQALTNAREAIELWMETVIDDGGVVPEPRPIDEHQADPAFAGWVWAVVDVDPAILSNKAERINITLPARVLRRIDAAAKRDGETRSGYITKLAIGTRTRPAAMPATAKAPAKKKTASAAARRRPNK